MNKRFGKEIVIVGLIVLVSLGVQGCDRRQAAIEKIEELGGMVEIDKEKSESAVMAVSLMDCNISDVELLEKLDCPAYKIGSDDAINIPFLEEVASIGKPILLSTGMCTMNEVRESVSAILGKGNADIILLHCVTNYPANPAHANLRCIPAMKTEFGIPVGYSDHTIGTACCIGAAAIGVNVLEKHFTHDKNAEGPDHMLSADTEEMSQIIESIRTIETAMGDGVKRPSEGEKTTRINNRKSIVSVQTIPKGTVITTDMIAIKRPGFGIQPKFFHEVIGRTAKGDIKAEEPILWNYV